MLVSYHATGRNACEAGIIWLMASVTRPHAQEARAASGERLRFGKGLLMVGCVVQDVMVPRFRGVSSLGSVV